MRPSALLLIGLLVGLSACGTSSGEPRTPMEAGRIIFRQRCAVCHGDRGQGGVGQSLAGVAETFPDCATHVRWIELGSIRWREEVGPTYGATSKVSEGVMPSFEPTLTDEQIRSVALFERVAFGGASETSALADCSLAEE